MNSIELFEKIQDLDNEIVRKEIELMTNREEHENIQFQLDEIKVSLMSAITQMVDVNTGKPKFSNAESRNAALELNLKQNQTAVDLKSRLEKVYSDIKLNEIKLDSLHRQFQIQKLIINLRIKSEETREAN